MAEDRRVDVDALEAFTQQVFEKAGLPTEDAAVCVAIEITPIDDLDGEVECVVVNEDGAKDRSFRFQIVGKRAVRSGKNGISHVRVRRSLESEECNRSRCDGAKSNLSSSTFFLSEPMCQIQNLKIFTT